MNQSAHPRPDIFGGMQLKSYWMETAPRFVGATGNLPAKADVVIVGGGFTGLSAALALAKKGADVVVVEMANIGNGGSGRNGGMCSNGLAIGFQKAVNQLGLERATSAYKSFDDAVDMVERIIGEEKIDCDFVRRGKIGLASKPEHVERQKRTFELLQRGVDMETMLVPRDRLPEHIGSDRFFGGLAQNKSALMHMGKFVHGLATAATRHGARIFENARMTGLKRLGGYKHEVTTTRGTIEASQVLIASGALTAKPQFFRRRIVPVGSFIIVTEQLSEAVALGLLPTRRGASNSKNLVNYFRLTPDNRLLFGGRARFALSSPTSDVKSGHILHAEMTRIFPQLGNTRIDYCWGGLVDLTHDRLPRAGEQDGLFYSIGYSGHGTQMATYMGRLMADVLGGKPASNIWGDLDWPAVPGHFGPPWFLPFVGAYYRFKDMVS